MIRYLIGVALLLVAFVPLSTGVHAVRVAFLPTWSGPPAVLAEILAVLGTIIVVTQTLGALGIYQLLVVTAVYALTGWGLHTFAGRNAAPTAPGFESMPPILGPFGYVLAVLATSFVAGTWAIRSAVGFTDGVPGADTLWYHLPAAARLVQTGSLQEIHHFDAGNLTAFYPNASTFFHATGMLFLGNDIVSPLINLGWAVLALLAGWCLGRPFGVAPVTLTAVATVLTFPGFVGHEAGSAMNDVTALALLLGAVALLATAAPPQRLTANPTVITLAAAATGGALATKWTVMPAAGALTLGVIVLADRESRLRVAVRWLVVSGLTGLFTFARNLVLVGNPLPPIELKAGPITFDNVGSDDTGYSTIRAWLFEDGAWDGVFRPGLDLWFGPLWLVALLGTAAGLLVGVTGRAGRVAGLAAGVGIVAVASYVFSPQYLEFLGVPAFFLSNLRYGVVALGMGLTALALLPILREGRRRWAAPGLFAMLMLASATSSGLWNGIDDWRFQDHVDPGDTAVGIVIVCLTAVVGLAVVRFGPGVAVSARRRVLMSIGVAVVVLSAVLRPAYIEERYAEAPFWSPATDLTDARIAMQGINTQFAMYGDDLSNHVQWVGDIQDHVFVADTNCASWRHTLNEGNYSHLIIGPAGKDRPGAYLWTRDDPAVVLVQDFDGDVASVFQNPRDPLPIAFFEITGPLDPDGCPT